MTILINKWGNTCHGWCMSSSIDQNPAFTCQQLVMRYCHGWLKFGWKNWGGGDFTPSCVM